MKDIQNQLLLKHNPFMFIDEQGDSLDFRTWLECYQQTLLDIYKSSRRGYFDAVLFLVGHTTQTLSEAENEVEKWRNMGLDVEYGALLIDWRTKTDYHKTLVRILRCLHMQSDSNLNSDMAYEAIRLLDLQIEKLQLEERQELKPLT